MKNLFLFLSIFALSNIANANSSFKGVNKKLGQCYSRTYSAEHLASNPKQTVTHMAAKFSYESFYAQGKEYTVPFLKIQAKVKGDNTVYGVELSCDDQSGYCYIECDGPHVDTRFSTNNPGSMLIDNSKGGLVLDPLTCDSMTEEEINAANLWLKSVKGGDDIFLLNPVPDFQCL